jgi:heterodisulfide reductase subunit B
MSATFLYYPGCSMDSSARAYADSLALIAEPLGITFDEIDDWNCCGASEYLSISQTRAYSLIGRNLALAEERANGSRTLVAPCSACYVNLAKTDYYLRGDRGLADTVNTALEAGGLHYTPGSVEVRHLVEILVDDVGVDEVKRHVVRPLTGLRLAPYLGCLLTRPDYDRRWKLREHPLEFDKLLSALGATVVDFPLRTDCCGGHMTQISPGTGFELIRRLVDAAGRLHADLLVTICPMCQMNVDAYQGEMNRYFHTHHQMPILFFTQLIGLAFGFPPEKLGIGSELVSARKALAKIGIEVQAPEVPGGAEGEPSAVGGSSAARPRREKKPQGLPMPRMSDDGEVRP